MKRKFNERTKLGNTAEMESAIFAALNKIGGVVSVDRTAHGYVLTTRDGDFNIDMEITQLEEMNEDVSMYWDGQIEELSSKEAIKMLGGRAAVRSLEDRANKLFGQWASVSIEPDIDEENPEEMDFLNLMVEMKYTSNRELPPKIMEMKEDALYNFLWKKLSAKGLCFEHECYGDGEEGPIDSFRIERIKG